MLGDQLKKPGANGVRRMEVGLKDIYHKRFLKFYCSYWNNFKKRGGTMQNTQAAKVIAISIMLETQRKILYKL